MLFALLVACRGQQPAPQDLDGLLHWFWADFDEGTDAELLAAAANLDPLVAALEESQTGTLEDLSDVAAFGRDVDPSLAAGMYMLTPLSCDPATAEAIAVDLDQDVLYDTFDAYERVYTSDAAAYLSRQVPTLSWDAEYEVSAPLLGSYSASLEGVARWVPVADGRGPLLMTRSVLTEPAVFDDPDDLFDQDWRIELYWPHADGVVHVEGLWRHFQAWAMDTDNPGTVDLILGGLVDWDEQTQSWCLVGWP